jgi:biotin transport system ATP-binding protein
MAVIEINNLSHRFSDGTLGLDRVNLSIEGGELVVLSGKNGSGKTVLVRHFNGLLKPTGGSVRIDGKDVGNDLLRARKLVGLVFQETDTQIVGETVSADIAFGPCNLGLPHREIEQQVERMLEEMGLKPLADSPPHLLSGGEKQRLAVAGVLAMEPMIVVFDEPFASLDYPGVKQVLKQIMWLSVTGHTLIIITHDLDKILAHADRLVLMDRGRIVVDGTPEEAIGEVERFGIRKPPGIDGRPGSKTALEHLTWLL